MTWLRWAMAIWLGALLGIYFGAWLRAEPIGFSVRGPLTATDQEAQEGYFGVAARPAAPHAFTLAIGRVHPIEQEQQECYFPIGNDASVNLNPRGDYCVRARELAGKTGTLLFVVDE